MKMPRWMRELEDGKVEVDTRDGKFVLSDPTEKEIAKLRRVHTDNDGRLKPSFEYALLAAMIEEPAEYKGSDVKIQELRHSTVFRLRQAMYYLLQGDLDFLQQR